jgi:hypothetical protein
LVRITGQSGPQGIRAPDRWLRNRDVRANGEQTASKQSAGVLAGCRSRWATAARKCLLVALPLVRTRAAALGPAFCAAVRHLDELGSGQVGKTVSKPDPLGPDRHDRRGAFARSRLGAPSEVMRPALAARPTDSRTLREIELMRLTWYVKDIDNARRMARRRHAAAADQRGPPANGPHHRSGIAALLGEGRPIDLPARSAPGRGVPSSLPAWRPGPASPWPGPSSCANRSGRWRFPRGDR